MATVRSAPADPTPEAVVDGRRARRERGRRAVLDAMIDLSMEGYAPPTTEQLAERAGVSVASLFRYYETLDELRRHAIERYFERFARLFDVPDIGVGPLDRRVRTLVAARVEQHEQTSPVARQVRARAAETPDLGESLHGLRAAQADQVRRHFAAELAGLPPAAADDAVATVAALTSFESWDQFRHDHGRSPVQIRRAWATALHRLLDHLGRPEGAPHDH